MVGSEEYQHVVFSEFFVQIIQQALQVAVEAQVHILHLCTAHAKLVPAVVGGGVAQRQEIRVFVHAEFHLVDDGEGEIRREAIAKGRAPHQARASLRLQGGQGMGECTRGIARETHFVSVEPGYALRIGTLELYGFPGLGEIAQRQFFIVEAPYPAGEGRYGIREGIVRRADPVASVIVKPEASVGDVPRRQDAAAVFDAYADHFGTQRTRQAQLVGNGGRQEDGGRVVAFGGGSTYSFVALIRRHVLVFGLGAVVPVVSYNTVHGGRRTGVDARMPGCCVSRYIIIMCVLARETFTEEAFEAAGSVFVVVPV